SELPTGVGQFTGCLTVGHTANASSRTVPLPLTKGAKQSMLALYSFHFSVQLASPAAGFGFGAATIGGGSVFCRLLSASAAAFSLAALSSASRRRASSTSGLSDWSFLPLLLYFSGTELP